MREKWSSMMVVAGVLAIATPSASGQQVQRPTGAYAVASDGSVYLPIRAEGSVVRIAQDGSQEVVANSLDSPTGVAFDEDGYLLIGDEVGTRRVDLAAGTLSTIQTAPTDFEPYVRFDQSTWRYRTDRVILTFAHNLGLTARFDIEVSRNGGRTWARVASRIQGSTFVWLANGWPTNRARFRVTAYVADRRICSDVSDKYSDPTTVWSARIAE